MTWATPPDWYPTDWRAQVEAAYPDLAPIASAHPPEHVVQMAANTARSLGWTIHEVDEASGTLRASEATALFRFVDDVAIRVRPAPDGGSVVDLRSKSARRPRRPRRERGPHPRLPRRASGVAGSAGLLVGGGRSRAARAAVSRAQR